MSRLGSGQRFDGRGRASKAGQGGATRGRRLPFGTLTGRTPPLPQVRAGRSAQALGAEDHERGAVRRRVRASWGWGRPPD